MSSLTSTCHCKSFSHTFTLPSTLSLPIPETTCSCTSCRLRTGALAIFPFPAVDPAIRPGEEVLGRLKKYESANEVTKSKVTSYFCGMCGSKVYIQVTAEDPSSGDVKIRGGGWFTGCLDKIRINGKPLMELHGHSFLEDTLDGGVSNVWKSHDGKPLINYADTESLWVPSINAPPPATPNASIPEREDQDLLHLHCHCNAFSVYITRPNPELTDGKLPRGCYWYRPGVKDGEGKPVGGWRYMASW